MSPCRKKAFLDFDPRTKIILLIISIISVTIAPSLAYELVLIVLIAMFGVLCGKIRYSMIGMILYLVLYGLTVRYLQGGTETIHTMFLAWLSLIFKVYPCCMLAGIVISTTKINEFLSAMNKAHVSSKVVIPIAVMLRYIPTIREDWHYIKDAMRLRGVSPSPGGFLKNPAMTVECLYVPLLIAASKAADELSIAAVTRGIEDPHPRTCIVQIRFRTKDICIICCFVIETIVGVFI